MIFWVARPRRSGFDLRDYKLADLRNQFAIVLQEPVLFSTSIGENIAYARPDASEDDIIAAATAANAHDFICRLPQGYGTVVGERGMRLSGGERQRISIARAFLKQAPLLILDEPTSSVDMKTEAAILEAMERLARGRTTFVITHRPSALERCDRVLRMELGRHGRTGTAAGVEIGAAMIVPDRTRAQLLARNLHRAAATVSYENGGRTALLCYRPAENPARTAADLPCLSAEVFDSHQTHRRFRDFGIS